MFVSPETRSSSDWGNSYSEISDLYQIYSDDTYDKLVGKFELYAMLEKGLDDIEKGKMKSVEEVFNCLESR